MMLSQNTQAILLLTAPLIAGRRGYGHSFEPLTPGEYKKVARFLREEERQPADLLSPEAGELLVRCQGLIDGGRLTRLLERGFLLSQAVEHWHARAIWVVSRADPGYPKQLKVRLKEYAPPVLYGCGELDLLTTGGLAVVGSRDVNSELIQYAEDVGRLVAKAGRTLVSGGARGIDQAAMRGALEAGGKAIGVLADGLERAAMNRDHRGVLMEGQLVLVSPYDPSAGFNVGNAMQRNKLIYALADAALVVNSDYQKGGTWTGAIEQLDRLRSVPVFVRANGKPGRGLEALRQKGALPWPDPADPDTLADVFAVEVSAGKTTPQQLELSLTVREEDGEEPYGVLAGDPAIVPPTPLRPAGSTVETEEDLLVRARVTLARIATPMTGAEIAEELGVSKHHANLLLRQLIEQGVVEKLKRPVRYRWGATPGPLFDSKR